MDLEVDAITYWSQRKLGYVKLTKLQITYEIDKTKLAILWNLLM